MAQTYYIRVDCSTDTPTSFKLVIKVNGVLHKTIYDTAVRLESRRVVKKIASDSNCYLHLTYSGPPYGKQIYSMVGDTIQYWDNIVAVAIDYNFYFNTNGTWFIQIDDGINYTISLTDASIRLYTNSSY
jgi:hypothetical protein